MNFVQLKVDETSYNIDYLETIAYTIYDIAIANAIDWYDNFPYVYLDADNEDTERLLKRFATLGWLGNEVVDTGEVVPFS